MAQPAESLLPLDLNTAITRALADNPALKAAGYQLQIQEARIVQAGIKPRPQLEIEVEDVFGSGVNDLLRGIQTTASISWILERGVRKSQISASRSRSSLIESDIAIRRLAVAAESARRYLESLDLQARQIIAAQGIVLG